ncbi:MAG: serine racemase VanT catalytic subunit [Lachnospiraceae bacterium]|nr:serine racemase VanT catalytic subunit [Lachnospiraceae bacterium]
MYEKTRAWIELNLDNLLHNANQLKSRLSPGCRLMPAVKANAYGHGSVLIARALNQMGIRSFCVASAREGAALREAGIEGQILVLGFTHPEVFPLLTKYDLTQTVVDAAYAGLLADYGSPLKVHISVDTGMRRLGERSEHLSSILSFWRYKTLKITGLYSHLCVADSPSPVDIQFTLMQFQRFDTIVDALHQKGIDGFSTHIQGSYGFLNYPEYHYDYIRPGIALYGCKSLPADQTKVELPLRPVLSLKARLVSIRALLPGESAGYGLTYTAEKPLLIGTVSIGYADGIPRSLSGKGYALVRGRRAPVIGRICMDQLLLDVTDIPDAAPMDEVVLIGSSVYSDGISEYKNEISVEELAQQGQTISNEILSCLGERLERITIPSALI